MHIEKTFQGLSCCIVWAILYDKEYRRILNWHVFDESHLLTSLLRRLKVKSTTFQVFYNKLKYELDVFVMACYPWEAAVRCILLTRYWKFLICTVLVCWSIFRRWPLEWMVFDFWTKSTWDSWRSPRSWQFQCCLSSWGNYCTWCAPWKSQLSLYIANVFPSSSTFANYSIFRTEHWKLCISIRSLKFACMGYSHFEFSVSYWFVLFFLRF